MFIFVFCVAPSVKFWFKVVTIPGFRIRVSGFRLPQAISKWFKTFLILSEKAILLPTTDHRPQSSDF